MLKKVIIATILIFSATTLTAAELKIGVVNIPAIVSKAPQVKAINEKVQKQFKEKYDELEALRKKGADLNEKAKRDEMTLTNAQKQDISRQLQQLDTDFKLKQTFLQEDINNANKVEQGNLMRIIQQAVAKVAADEKFDLILNGEAVVHAVPAINISDKVIAIISNPAG